MIKGHRSIGMNLHIEGKLDSVAGGNQDSDR
jgi:hypothetical protein